MDSREPRVEPVSAPYPPDLQAVFDRIMPPGVAPLTLFTWSHTERNFPNDQFEWI